MFNLTKKDIIITILLSLALLFFLPLYSPWAFFDGAGWFWLPLSPLIYLVMGLFNEYVGILMALTIIGYYFLSLFIPLFLHRHVFEMDKFRKWIITIILIILLAYIIPYHIPDYLKAREIKHYEYAQNYIETVELGTPKEKVLEDLGEPLHEYYDLNLTYRNKELAHKSCLSYWYRRYLNGFYCFNANEKLFYVVKGSNDPEDFTKRNEGMIRINTSLVD